MKRTDKSQADYENLHRAICALEEVMTYVHASLYAGICSSLLLASTMFNYSDAARPL